MYATGSPAERRRTRSRMAATSADASGWSKRRYRSMRRSASASAQSSSASSRGVALPCVLRYVVLRRTISSSVRGWSLSAARSCRVLGFVEQPARLVLLRQRLDEQVEIAVEHALQLMQREVDAVVGDARLREVVRAHLLAAVAAAHHGTARLLELLLPLGLGHVVQARAQH